MEQLEIHQPVVSSQVTRDDVIALQQVSWFEVQSTGGAPSLLAFEQVSCSCANQGMVFESLCPVHQVSIIWAGLALDLYMPPNGGSPMLFERRAFLGLELP